VGDLHLSAGQDINLKAANVSAETGGLWATASRDINLTTGKAYNFADDAHQSKSKGFLASKTTSARDTVERILALTAANVVSDRGADLWAGRDIKRLLNLKTAVEKGRGCVRLNIGSI
jgi:filamentous hemagglutinin